MNLLRRIRCLLGIHGPVGIVWDGTKYLFWCDTCERQVEA